MKVFFNKKKNNQKQPSHCENHEKLAGHNSCEIGTCPEAFALSHTTEVWQRLRPTGEKGFSEMFPMLEGSMNSQ